MDTKIGSSQMLYQKIQYFKNALCYCFIPAMLIQCKKAHISYEAKKANSIPLENNLSNYRGILLAGKYAIAFWQVFYVRIIVHDRFDEFFPLLFFAMLTVRIHWKPSMLCYNWSSMTIKFVLKMSWKVYLSVCIARF